MDTLETIIKTIAEEPTEQVLKSITQIVKSEDDPVVPFACAIAIAYGQSPSTRLTDEAKRVFERLATETNRRARVSAENSAESLFARGAAQLLNFMRDQFNNRTEISRRYTRRIEEAKALIEKASLMEPENKLYELAHAVSLRFFSVKVKRDNTRKEEGFSRLVALSQHSGSVGVAAKLMIADHATRRREWDLLSGISADLKRALPGSSCMRALAGTAHLHLRHEASARREYKAALKMNPNDPIIQRQLNEMEEFFSKRQIGRTG